MIHLSFSSPPLQACKLDDVLREQCGSISQILSTEVTEKGANFSLGQRQLLCLCRVLLKQTRIICVDEATASLDVATDAITRRTIGESFKHATVIMVCEWIGQTRQAGWLISTHFVFYRNRTFTTTDRPSHVNSVRAVYESAGAFRRTTGRTR